MSQILLGMLKWLAWKAAALLLILAVLLSGAWLAGELKRDSELRRDRAELAARRDTLEVQTEKLKQAAGEAFKKAEAVYQKSLKTWARESRMLDAKRAERQRFGDAHFLTRQIPGSDAWLELKRLDGEIVVQELRVHAAARVMVLHGKALRELQGPGAEVVQKVRERELIDKQITGIDETLTQGYVSRLRTAVSEELPLALKILLGIILLPMALKLFFYFVVAPLAAGRPPIRLLPSASGSVVPTPAEDFVGTSGAKMSAVSCRVVLREDEELLIKSPYLQSTSLHAGKSTRIFLNPHIPFSSLASGMVMLTRVGPAGTEAVVISATEDPLSEVGVVELTDGAAFVCQPRSLAGVIQYRGKPIRITRHWRLGSLQGWLTLQLRFLVFHGPGKLIMKGCRGIRIEPAGGTGRLINQSATLGFSANLDYANTRCETFWSYWTGKEDLFNDLFTGTTGVYVYEEMPGLKRSAGITGRGLEGVTDAALKVFGV